MKTKDSLLKGIIIGISVIVVPLILMGTTHTNTESEIGKYQISITDGTMGNWVYETIIDTRTGQVISRERRLGYGSHYIDKK